MRRKITWGLISNFVLMNQVSVTNHLIHLTQFVSILLENEASAVYGDPPHEFCLQLNVSQCHVSETANTFVVTAYNPKAQPVSQYLRLPVIEGPYTVTDPDGGSLNAAFGAKHAISLQFNLTKDGNEIIEGLYQWFLSLKRDFFVTWRNFKLFKERILYYLEFILLYPRRIFFIWWVHSSYWVNSKCKIFLQAWT